METKEYKQKLLEQLYEPYKKCLKCPLGSLGRTKVVFGEGDPDAAIIFIGEGPGRDEDSQGKPFVGKSGQLLNQLFTLAGINRSSVFITNIVKCRPPNNRTPLPHEMETCKKLLLLKQIRIIRPKIICTLGSAALQGLLNQSFKITQVRGSLLSFENITVIPTYHPAYILRNPKELPTLANDIQTAINMSLK